VTEPWLAPSALRGRRILLIRRSLSSCFKSLSGTYPKPGFPAPKPTSLGVFQHGNHSIE